MKTINRAKYTIIAVLKQHLMNTIARRIYNRDTYNPDHYDSYVGNSYHHQKLAPIS